MMKIVLTDGYGSAFPAYIGEKLTKSPEYNQVEVEVYASSVNPVDWKVRQGAMKFLTGRKFPRKIGADFAGVITRSKLVGFEPGDRVFGMIPALKGGAHAQYLIAGEHNLCRMPESLDFLEAASIPLVGLTAFQALVHIGHISIGHSVLINGASGGVGMMAVQIAKAYGATVTAICSTRNIDWVKDLGADTCIDYTKEKLPESEKFDIVFDVVGNIKYKKGRKYLNKGGRFIIATPTAKSLFPYVFSRKVFVIMAKPNETDLNTLAQLITEKKLRTHIDKVFGLHQIDSAHAYSATGRTRGKIAIDVKKITDEIID